VKKRYHTVNKQGKANEVKLAEFLSGNGQLLLPMVGLIEQCRLACDEVIQIAGRATIQAVLQLSAEEVAGGPPQHGKRRLVNAVLLVIARIVADQTAKVFFIDGDDMVEESRGGSFRSIFRPFRFATVSECSSVSAQVLWPARRQSRRR